MRSHACMARKRLSKDQRREIASKYSRGITYKKLIEQYHSSYRTIKRWAHPCGTGDKRFQDMPRRARTSVFSKAQRQAIRRSALNGKTVAGITKRICKRSGLEVSVSTTRRVLTQGRNPLHWLPILHGRTLSTKNKQARVDFCIKHKNSQVGSWVFGDAKMFQIYKCKRGYHHYAWQRLNDNDHMKVSTNPIVIMFYGFIGKDMKSKLIFTDPTPPARSKQHKSNKNFNSTSFKVVVHEALPYLTLPSGDTRRRVVVLDRARQHTSKASTEYLAQCGVKLLEGYPAQSWDINVIENVWGMLDTNMQGCQAKTPRGWREKIREAWDKISQDSINDLVDEVKERMALIIEKEGAWLCNKGK